MNKIVRGVFADFEDVAIIIARLELSGFTEDEISIISNEENDLDSFKISENTKLPEGIAIGSATGGILGAIAGSFATVGAFATGGIGILAAGPIATAFAAGAAGGALGGVYGTVFPDNEKQYYQDCVNQGAILIVAHCQSDEQVDKAKQIFEQYNPIKVG